MSLNQSSSAEINIDMDKIKSRYSKLKEKMHTHTDIFTFKSIYMPTHTFQYDAGIS